MKSHLVYNRYVCILGSWQCPLEYEAQFNTVHSYETLKKIAFLSLVIHSYFWEEFSQNSALVTIIYLINKPKLLVLKKQKYLS